MLEGAPLGSPETHFPQGRLPPTQAWPEDAQDTFRGMYGRVWECMDFFSIVAICAIEYMGRAI